MNDRRQQQSGGVGGAPRPAPADRRPVRRAAGLGSWGTALRRQWLLLATTFGAILAIGLLATLSAAPRYVATAEVLLADGDTGVAADGADPQVAAIRSRAMAARVAAGIARTGETAAFAPGGNDVSSRLVRLLGRGTPAPDRDRLAALRANVSARRLDETLSLSIAFTAANAAAAARIADEYARQYAAASAPAGRTNARILSEAEPPAAPSSPNWLLATLITIGLGTVTAVAAALIRERMLGGLTSGSEVEDRLGLHHLGIVPAVRSVVPDAASPEDAIVAAPMSGFAEAVRSLAPAIRYSGGGRAQVVAITSAVPGEGASTLALCLARSMALAGEHVVLIGTALPGIDRGDGLARLLRGEATLDEALVADAPSGAWILAGGAMDAAAMPTVLTALRERFGHVLIDLPAIRSSEEARALCGLADLVVLAVRWRSTPDRIVRRAVASLPADVRIGGVVLTQVDMHKQVKYAQGDASYYYTKLSKYYS